MTIPDVEIGVSEEEIGAFLRHAARIVRRNGLFQGALLRLRTGRQRRTPAGAVPGVCAGRG